jgi:hypothetical protein
MIGFICTSVTISLNYNQQSALADLHNFQFTVTHALGFSVSISRLLATGLNIGYACTMSTLSVSCQRILTEERLLQITMKYSSTQFSNANSLSLEFAVRLESPGPKFQFCVLLYSHSLDALYSFLQTGFLIETRHRSASQKTRHVIATHCCGVTSLRMRKLYEHKENTAAVLLCDVTAYVEMCLSSRCLERGCLTLF